VPTWCVHACSTRLPTPRHHAPPTHYPQSRHRQRQPYTLCTRSIPHLRLVPLPPPTLQVRKPTLYPRPHRVPLRTRPLRQQVRHYQPRLRLPCVPTRQQSAFQRSVLETDYPPTPLRARLRHHRRQSLIGRLPRLSVIALRVDAQKGMPPPLHNPRKQPLGIQPPIRTHQHGPIFGDRVAQRVQQRLPIRLPTAWLVGRNNLPRHRDGAAVIQHADAQHREALLEGRGI
jgi:hypothetical protein